MRSHSKDELDDPKETLKRCKVLLKNPFLSRLYREWYGSFIKLIPGLPIGPIIEIGSGAGFMKSVIPQIITSDLMPLPICDLCLTAEQLPFKDGEISAIFMINVLHHIKRCENFFAEAQRVLKKDGLVFMIEPANTLVARFIYQNMHHEAFEPDSAEWSIRGDGPLSDANGALPWIIFERDYSKFVELFPNFIKVSLELHTPYAYLLSGGFSMNSIVPVWAFNSIRRLEKATKWLLPYNAMFQSIIIKRV